MKPNPVSNRFRGVLIRLFLFVLMGMINSARGETPVGPVPAGVARGRNGIVVGSTGSQAVRAGLQILQDGGSAADAAMATALAEVVECGGCFVSFAGVLGLLYYDAASHTVYALNAGYDTPRGEKDPKSIPTRGVPSGRTALVPGFMAGVLATLDRFGKLPRKVVFAPAIRMAAEGVPVTLFLADNIQYRRDVLGRLPETRHLFIRPDGQWLKPGDLLRQSELAAVLREVSEQGRDVIYTGRWAKKFVDTIQREGGNITLDDMRAYSAIWEAPLETRYRGYQVLAPGLSSRGGIDIIQGLNLLELADMTRSGHYSRSALSLCRLMQISACSLIDKLPPGTFKDSLGHDLTGPARLSLDSAKWIWARIQDGTWPLVMKPSVETAVPASHSDGILVVDRAGNFAVVTHSINTNTWGTTGIFVDGISIPDSASININKDLMVRVGPGRRLPDSLSQLIILRDGRPVLGSTAVGSGLHPRTLQALSSILDFGMDVQAAADAPSFLFPAYRRGQAIAQVAIGAFEPGLIDAVTKLGQAVVTLPESQAATYRGYWLGVQIDREHGGLLGGGDRKFCEAVGY